MATAEAETSQDERGEPGGLVYDGFVSYSHAGDDLLAPRLQAGLQRFAKPWWKRRALRIFRDESSLSANPHLWSSIADALDQSGWFVLLLSPEAAESPWVDREVEYWLANKDPERIIPVLTDGEFGWADGDVTGDAVPPALQVAFADEPRWVDLRFARTEEQLDLQNPAFSAVVADIASAMRGVPKDQLASEEVRQHRKAVRTAWAAGIGLAVLAAVAGAASIFAVGQRDEAQANAKAEAVARADADANALAEAEARQEADENAESATLNAAEADRQAKIARARELGASAIEALDIDPELATLLALEAYAISGDEQPPVVVNAIWRAIQSDHLEYVLPGTGKFAQLDLSLDDSMLAVTSQVAVQMYTVPGGELQWTFIEEDSPDGFLPPHFSPDGTRVALSVADSTSPDFAGLADIPPDDRPNRILILDAASGTLLDTLEYPSCQSAAVQAWSLDGSQLVVNSGWESCPRDGTSGVWVELLDATTLESVVVWDTPNENEVAPQAAFTPDGELVLTGWFQDAIVRSGLEYENERVLEGVQGFGAVAPNGSFVTAWTNQTSEGQTIHNLPGGELRDIYPIPTFPALPVPAVFSEDGGILVIQTEGRETVVFDVATGRQLFSLPGGAGGNPAISSDGVWLYTSHRDGTVKVWNLEPKTVGQTVVEVLGPNDHVQGQPEFSIGPSAGSAFFLDIEEFTPRTVFFSTESGEIIDQLAGAFRSLALADGRFVHQLEGGEIGVYNPDTGEGSAIAGCFSSDEDFPFFCDATGEPQPNLDVNVSVNKTEVMIHDRAASEWWIISPDDGSILSEGGFPLDLLRVRTFSDGWIVGMADSESFVAIDRSNGEELARVEVGDNNYAVSNDGSLIAIPDQGQGRVVVVELESWDSWEIDADFGRPRAVAFSPSNRLLAIGDENNIVIVDMENRRQIQTLPVSGTSSFYWFDEETILIGTSFPARWVTISLNAAGLDDAARESITRSFTDIECAMYGIDPCPTLDDIRSR